MTKQEFISILRNRCTSLDSYELEEVISYYEEIINERLEAGEKEEDIINSFGNIDTIIGDLYANIPLKRIIQKKYQEKQSNPWLVVLIILGIPFFILFLPIFIIFTIFFSLFVAVLAIFSVFGIIWQGFALVYALASLNFIDSLFHFGVILIFVGLLSFSSDKKHYVKKDNPLSKIKKTISRKRGQ